MRSALKVCVVLATVALIWAPARARADGYVSPWVSANAGAGFSNGNINFENGRAGFGLNAGAMGAGIIGGEIDLGFSPSFFGTQNDYGNNSVIDFMGNVIDDFVEQRLGMERRSRRDGLLFGSRRCPRRRAVSADDQRQRGEPVRSVQSQRGRVPLLARGDRRRYSVESRQADGS
jgi:hypothetical protein